MKTELDVGFKALTQETDSRLSFTAAALAVGFELCDKTPGVSNVYDTDRKFEPGEAGDVKIYLPLLSDGININEFIEVWNDPEEALDEAGQLPYLIQTADNAQLLVSLQARFDVLYLSAAIAYMRLESQGKIKLPGSIKPTREEIAALDMLDTFAAQLTPENLRSNKSRVKLAQELQRHWQAAMYGWLKCYRQNILEIRNLWQEVPPAIRIKRKGLPPLILEKGPKFEELLQRWT